MIFKIGQIFYIILSIKHVISHKYIVQNCKSVVRAILEIARNSSTSKLNLFIFKWNSATKTSNEMILFQQGWKFCMYSQNMAVHNIIVWDVSRGVWAMFIDLHTMNTCAVQLQCVYHVFNTQTAVDPYSAGKVSTFRNPWTHDITTFSKRQ